MKNTRVPTKIMLGACVASHWAVREMQEDGELPGRVKVRSSQYLNNLGGAGPPQSEPMLAFKRFDNAVVTSSGIELAEKIKKGSSSRANSADVGTMERDTRSLSSIRNHLQGGA